MPEILQLKNGLRAIHYYIPDSPVVHCGIMVNCGGRDEPKSKAGLAHFIEHIFFKGTKKRSSRQILNSLEVLGEETCIHASIMKQHLPKAADVIADIFLNATFPARELEKEKKVILDEIHAYEDIPYEQIYDDFECVLFKNHPLGNPILGKENDIKSFTQKDVRNFIQERYHLNNTVWMVAGSITKEEVLQTAALFYGAKNKGKQ
jgi:predicted Zn-dependent peptidase